MKYVLITPARNEESLIGLTLESVVAQTVLPARWVIVDDGSQDRTAEIVADYARRFDWIDLVRRPLRAQRNFAGKVESFNAGLAQVQTLHAELIGNLDSDISFGPDHFEFLISKFVADPALGVAGTAYTEIDWDSTKDSFEGELSVHGACQLFRAECLRDIGGYVANPLGGVDWIAVTTARMKGWHTRNFRDRTFVHHRPMGTAQRTALGAMFDYGKKDYFLGNSPLWQIGRVIYRAGKKPLAAGGLALLAGYCWAAMTRLPRPVTPELMRFHRREQLNRLKNILRSVVTLRKIEKFHSLPDDAAKSVAPSDSLRS